ncbi:MAG: methyltransferase [Pirellulales bacterium]
MQQQTFNFDQLAHAEPAHDAETTSLPPPVAAALPVPLVRPDRQLTYGGAIHFEWPAPEHDRDTITVDRIREDIDGPSHRFVICRGDTVEVFFSHEKTDIGEVVGISHANVQVCVRFPGGKDGVWLSKGQIYPSIETTASGRKNGQRLSEVIAEVNGRHGAGLTEADRVLPIAGAAPTPRFVLRFLETHAGQEFALSDLRREFGCVDFDPDNPLANPVNHALRTLRDSGQAHVVEPRWGEPRFSVLKLPDATEDLTLAQCPQTMRGAELHRLFRKHKHTIAEFAKQYGFTQKHVREVFERGLDNQNAVRDWLEAILPRRDSTKTAATAAESAPTTTASYTFDEYKQIRRSFADGSLPYSEFHAHFAKLCESQGAIVNELTSRFNAKELVVIAGRMGSWDANRSTKDENAKSIYRKMLSSFVLDGMVSYSMGERYEDAVKSKVQAVTLESYAQDFAERQAKADEHSKALTDPQTFFEFRTFLQAKSEADLSDEQLARYDVLHADMTRERRAAQVTTTVEQFKSEELGEIEFQIKQGYHDKRQCPIWIVQLSTRVERAAFDELNRKAKMLGGWFSSFKRSDSGFQFLDEERAKRFTALLSGDADRRDVLEARKERREQTASERLHELAEELAKRADEVIERSESSLQNTVRRADIQAGVRGRAFSDQALARTMHSIAEALSRGEANYLDGIRHKTHIETLDTVLYLAKWARVRAAKRGEGETTYSHGSTLDRIEDEPIGPKDIRFAKYPIPEVYKRNLEELVLRCQSARGVRQAAEKMRKRLSREKDDFVTFRNEHDIEALSDFLGRAKGAGFDVERIELTLEKHKRLQRANITDVHELRSALREYLGHRAAARGDDPVKIAERELIGKNLPGFFPTPPSVIARMLELSEIGPEHSVLEPSCGKGDIVDAVIAEQPDAKLHAIELNHSLAEVLSAKGHDVEFGDFLEHAGSYDRVVMNPPFEDGADMEHIRHAHSLLKPGGRLVSVISEGPFFRVDNKSVAFRDWLEEVSAEVERLPDDAFIGAEAFRETSVRTRLVVITKEGDA